MSKLGGKLCLKTERCSNELVAKWRRVPSLVPVNIALSMALKQERQRQDGCASLKAACLYLSPSLSFTLSFTL